MLRKCPTPAKVLTLSVSVLACLAVAAADDKNPSALSGAWQRTEGELKIEFAKDTMRIAPHGTDDVLVILCDCSIEKGQVKAKVSGYEGKEEIKDKVKGHLPVGSEFSFKWSVEGDTGTLDDLKSDKADVLKSRLEGKYEVKK